MTTTTMMMALWMQSSLISVALASSLQPLLAAPSSFLQSRRRRMTSRRRLQTCDIVDESDLEELKEGAANFSNQLRTLGESTGSSIGLAAVMDTVIRPQEGFPLQSEGAVSWIQVSGFRPPTSLRISKRQVVGFTSVSVQEGNRQMVETDMRFVYSDKDNFDAFALVTNPVTLDFITDRRLQAVPVEGELDGDGSKSSRSYRALVLYSDLRPDDALFIFVDHTAVNKRLKHDVKEQRRQDGNSGEGRRRLGQSDVQPKCPNKTDTTRAKCVKRANKRFQKACDAIKEPSRVSISALKADLRDLDRLRYQQFARVAADCAAAPFVDSVVWDPAAVQQCITQAVLVDASPDIYRQYLLTYTIDRNEILFLSAGRSIDVRTLETARNAKLLKCCVPVERRRTSATLSGNSFDVHGDNDDYEDVHHDDLEENYSVRYFWTELLDDEDGFGEDEEEEDNMRSWVRDLQNDSEATTCGFKAFDEELQAELEEFPETLFRSLAGNSAVNDAPEAFKVRGFESGESSSQIITSRTASFSLEIQAVTSVDVDILSLIDKKETPSQVRRIVKKGDYDATAVEGVDTDTGTEFVGIVFQRRNRQVLYPVDFSLFIAAPVVEELTRRVLSQTLESPEPEETGLVSRRLQDVVVDCQGPLFELDATCEAQAFDDFADGQRIADEELNAALVDVALEREEAEKVRLESYFVGGGLCDLKLGDNDVDDDAEFFLCVQFEESPAIIERFVTVTTQLDNRETQARAQRAGREGELTAILQTELNTNCCMNVVPPTVSPTNEPIAPPTLAPTDNPTGAPAVGPSQTPTLQPTILPTQSPSGVPSLPPVQNPTSGPTLNPIQPSRNPTLQPSRNPTLDPTANPTGAPTTKEPTHKPSHQPTSKPTFGPSVPPTPTPTVAPTTGTTSPTQTPTLPPTGSPTNAPTRSPTVRPSSQPTSSPSSLPTTSPSRSPTTSPSRSPTKQPTGSPTPLTFATTPTVVDFETFADGTAVTAGTTIDFSKSFPFVRFNATRNADIGDGLFNDGMIFDASATPTQAPDLTTDPTAINMLIISADGNSAAPDDNNSGGRINIQFDAPSQFVSFTLVDNRVSGGDIRFFDRNNNEITGANLPQTLPTTMPPVNFATVSSIVPDAVTRLVVTLGGSGAIDDLTFKKNSNLNAS